MPRVMINEIAWMGDEGSANNEWIELKNTGSGDIDLSGWKLKATDGQPEIELSGQLPANSFFLLERTSDESVKNIDADLIYTGALGNNGETLYLYDENNNAIDEIVCSGKWPGGDNSSKKTLSRRTDLAWGTSEASGGTPKAENQFDETISVQEEEPSDETDNGGSIEESITPGTILINEFYSQPKEDEKEWIELINTGMDPIDLSTWTIEDGSGAKMLLEDTIGGPGNNFLVIENLKFNLNNKGDMIILRDKKENVVDKVVYGDRENGPGANNAPAPKGSESCARIGNAGNSWNNYLDFSLTDTITKGSDNIIIENKIIDDGRIYVTEILPNPPGADNAGGLEFVELFNAEDKEIDVGAWKIKINEKKEFAFSVVSSSTMIKASGYLAIRRQSAKLTLPNGNGTIKLIRPDDEIWQTIEYSEAPEGKSYNLTDDCAIDQIDKCDWQWSERATPGEKNIFNYLDEIQEYFVCPKNAILGKPVIFDASDMDNGDKLQYEWDFGNGSSNQSAVAEHIFAKKGKQRVILTVKDNGFSKTQICEIDVGIDDKTAEKERSIHKIVINEIMPNPEGDDKGEWIELKNIGENDADIYDWQIKDSTTKVIFKVLSNTVLKPENFYLAKSAQGLSLNNSKDAVYLYNERGDLIDSAGYSDPEENIAYARGANGGFFWTSIATPGEENQIKVSDVKKNVIAESKKTVSDSQIKIISLENIKDCQPGDIIKTKGKVAVLPGIFSSQYFYIIGSPGAQVYSSKKDFPALNMGDTIEVEGEISEINNEKRIKIKQAKNIRLLAHGQLPSPQNITGDSLSAELAGQLVKVDGEIIKKSGRSFFLDDGIEEIAVYAKDTTGIDMKDIKIGDRASVVGILSLSKTGERILPRGRTDITTANLGKEPKVEVIGEKTEKVNWELPARNKTRDLIIYFGIMACMLGGGFFVYKKYYS